MPDVQDLIHAHLFDQAPIMIAVLDPRFAIVEANAAFKDGRLRIHEEGLETRTGERKHFVTRVAPLVRPGRDSESYLIWMGSAVNEAASLQEENELLFERVPCYVNVVDRDLKIVRANRRMRDTFGGRQGDYCYQVFKRRTEPCENCPVLQVFEDGLDHKADQVGVTSSGEEARYVVTATPLVKEQRPSGDRVKYVIEMSTDVTHLHRLEREKWEAERLAAVGRTVAGLAHGIKNILMGLEGGVYVMESGLKRGQTEKVEPGRRPGNRGALPGSGFPGGRHDPVQVEKRPGAGAARRGRHPHLPGQPGVQCAGCLPDERKGQEPDRYPHLRKERNPWVRGGGRRLWDGL
ncbi:MAG: PAS domain-containing protein [Acidobacteriota bacterium]